jgi:Arc/MetJ-type ribon-helix-helix transcriptional regulator
MAATKKKPAKLKIRLLRMPKKHKGNIPAEVIRAAVKQVVAESKANAGKHPAADNGGDDMTGVSATTFDDSQRHLLAVPVRIPGEHRGKIPAAVIREAVEKVAEERRRKTAEAAGQSKTTG